MAEPDIAGRHTVACAGVPIVRRATSNPQTLHHSIYNQSIRDNSKSSNAIKYRPLRIPMIPLTSISRTKNTHTLPLAPPKMISVRHTTANLMNSQSHSRSILPGNIHDRRLDADEQQQQQRPSLRKLEKKLKRISIQMDGLKLLEEEQDSVEDETESFVVPNMVGGVVLPSRSFLKQGSRNTVS
ncbi:hypothetical protein HK100_001568 [Physocladia obscura]|uniref:Uncharacterized protein n=1 Tax=Physocladia obscura TaxID=109957 RepID=A0AAD5XAY7_9FUNG|nr:hypothetical protein HK100_001568 [Physocladia obscura]